MLASLPLNGAVFKEPNFPTVFYMRDGHKCAIASETVLLRQLGRSWEDVEYLTWDDINRLPNGAQEDGHLPPVAANEAAKQLGWSSPYLHCYDHTYFEGSQHIESWTRLFSDGKIEGTFRYHNDSMLGFCGGIAVLTLDANNAVVHRSAPPTGCINGKPPGHEITRDVMWGDQVSSGELARALRINSKAFPTSADDKELSPEHLLQWAKKWIPFLP